MYNICQFFNFFDVIEEYYVSKIVKEEQYVFYEIFCLFLLEGKIFFVCVNGLLIQLKIIGSENCELLLCIEIEFNKDVILFIIEMFVFF